MQSNEYLGALESALDEFRWSDVGDLVHSVDPRALTLPDAKRALSSIRRKRRFAELEQLAAILLLGGHEDPEVRRQWIQALLDQDRISQGLAALESLWTRVDESPDERPEVRGLMGRAYKQRYVHEGHAQDLVRAIEWYRGGWAAREGDYRWQGINLAALLARARRDGVNVAEAEEDSGIAGTILDEVETLEHPRHWDRATALEAAIATGRSDDALRLAKEYAEDPAADAFELGSTLRQLREVWGLPRQGEGPSGAVEAALMTLLEYQFLQRSGASLPIDKDHDAQTDHAREGYERVFGSESYVGFQWMDNLNELTAAVGRVFDRSTGEAQGTGFLIRGSALFEPWGDAPVFVTNAHVVSTNPSDQPALAPDEAAAEFTRMDGRPTVDLGEVLFSSPREQLDCTIARISDPGAKLPAPHFYRPIVPAEDEAPQRLYVIGYPMRGELVISLHDNHLVGYEDPYVHYRSPTDPGSSGSPVMTRKLKVLALHHRSRNDVKANEGVLLAAIRDQVAAT